MSEGRDAKAARDAVVATYRLAGEFDLETNARVVAMEQSTGTWTELKKRTGSLEDRLAAWVDGVDEEKAEARIAFPLEIFEPRNIPGVLSIVAGNLFGLGSLDRARWVDIEFPEAFTRGFPGPGFGIPGVRKVIGTHDTGRPHGGTIVKPKVGLDPDGTAAVAREAALGGLDFIKDDETLTDQAFCPMEERGDKVVRALDEVREETGKTTLYALNVTTGGDDIVDRWRRVEAMDTSVDCVMIDVLTSGFDALLRLREECDVPIHVHRAMHGAMTRSTDYGIDMLPLCKLTRLCGGDQLHVGSATGKMEHPEHLQDLIGALTEPWHGFKPVFPVSSGGLHPGSVAGEYAAFGPDFVCQAGGGIHGHPDGTTAGAKAMMQAIEAAHAGRSAHDGPPSELATALQRWKGESYRYDA